MDAYFRVDVLPDGTVALEGELDAGSAHLLTEAVEVLPVRSDELVLDLSDLTFIDAAGARSLAGLATSRPQRSIVARSVRRNVARVCDLMPGVLPDNVRIERARRRIRGDRTGAWGRLTAATTSVARRTARRNPRLRSAVVWTLRRLRALRRRVRARIAVVRKRRPPTRESLAPGSR
jgi:anti-anti-sigma factor